jgi:CRISPR-associated endonuclease/helicase Cas3
VAGSALPRKDLDEKRRAAWIGEAFRNRPLEGELEKVWQRKLGESKELYDFQKAVGESTAPVTFVKAGCGSGKTLAAYLWAAAQYPTKRLYFCYPTTGTATEGFKDYLHNPEAQWNYSLFHGRAEVDLEIVLQAGTDDERPEADALARIEPLDAWSTPVVSCTVDTVLGLVQNNRRGLYAWPALAGAAFVFDEIHAYDDRLFGALLRFLQALRGVPGLLMTASLPAARKKALEQCLQRLGRALPEVAGPVEMERRPRYRRQGDVGPRDPLPEVLAHLRGEGGQARVLWVCNTVDRAINAANAARADGLDPLIYHSRFRYEDRVVRHKAVIDAFKATGPVLAVCTQVAEMSLDRSATLLGTELAPVPALIQRLGRLNRQAKEGDPTRPFIVVEPESHLPDTPPEREAARAWLSRLGDGDLSQEQLARAWESEDAERRPAYVGSAWLDGGPTTQVLELREASPGVTVVLERDRQSLKESRKALARVARPMPPPPRGLNWREWPRTKGVPIAPDDVIDYDPKRGARWRK